MIKESIYNTVNRLFEGKMYCAIRNIHFQIMGYPIRIKWDGNNYLVENQSNVIYLATKVRYGRYSSGINNFLDKLAAIYYLDQIDFEEGDVLVDCGANIGELGMWLNKRHPISKYIGIEPSEAEYAALQRNVKNGLFHNCALWFEKTRMKLFLAVDSADSSLINNGVADKEVFVDAIPLEELLADIPVIKVLKIEAEGAEPEVLLGAKEILQKCEYVVVDTGPERGVSKQTTTNEVENLLESRGFVLMNGPNYRSVCLFQRIS